MIPDFARDILAGRDIVMLSDGAAKRTFCYVADAVVGYYKVLVKGRAGRGLQRRRRDPGDLDGRAGRTLVALGRELFGYQGSVVRKESAGQGLPGRQPEPRCPIITKARTELGYDPQVALDEGLRRSLLWYSGNREAAEA